MEQQLWHRLQAEYFLLSIDWKERGKTGESTSEGLQDMTEMHFGFTIAKRKCLLVKSGGLLIWLGGHMCNLRRAR